MFFQQINNNINDNKNLIIYLFGICLNINYKQSIRMREKCTYRYVKNKCI